MARLTSMTKSEASTLATCFGLQLAEVEALDAGSVNSNFCFRLVDGRRAFGRVYEEQDQPGASQEQRLLAELATHGIPGARPWPTPPGGESIVSHRGKPFGLYEWLDGDLLCAARVLPAHLFELGRAVARLHLLTPKLTPLAEGRFGPNGVRRRLNALRVQAPEYAQTVQLILDKLEYYENTRNTAVPRGVIHGDLFRDNVLWAGEQILALLDFESACPGPFAYDIMVCVLAWCFTTRFEPELVGAFLRGYEGQRPLLSSERDALPTEGAMACLRFATTRLTDFELRTAKGGVPARDYRRFLLRLEHLEQGALQDIMNEEPKR